MTGDKKKNCFLKAWTDEDENKESRAVSAIMLTPVLIIMHYNQTVW